LYPRFIVGLSTYLPLLQQLPSSAELHPKNFLIEILGTTTNQISFEHYQHEEYYHSDDPPMFK